MYGQQIQPWRKVACEDFGQSQRAINRPGNTMGPTYKWLKTIGCRKRSITWTETAVLFHRRLAGLTVQDLVINILVGPNGFSEGY